MMQRKADWRRGFLIRAAAWIGAAAIVPASALGQDEAEIDFDKIEAVSLFDGETFEGWDGNLMYFRVEDGAVVGGSLAESIPRNEFLCTDKEYGDFELRLDARLIGERANAGIQIRSRRIPDHHEMIGYQADMASGAWGGLYDESRRRKMLAEPDADAIQRALKPDGWNEYRIRCVGRRVQLWINGVRTVDYTEPDESIEQTGLIGLQIHKGGPSESWYKNIFIKEVPAR